MMFVDAIDKFMHLVPGCPEPEAIDALRDAVIEFCEHSHSWVHWVDKTSNAMSFPTNQDAQALPIGLFDAYLGALQLDVIDLNDQQAPPVDQFVLTFDRTRLHDSIQIMPAPAEPTAVRLLVSWKPTPWAGEFPDHLWFSRSEALKGGALARLLAAPGTRYADADLAGFYDQRFRRAISAATGAAGVNRRTHLQRLRVRPAE